MTDYLCKIDGLLGATRPWSMGFHLTGASSEAALSATFTAAAATLFNTAVNGINNFVTSDVTTTQTETITLGPTMKAVSKTIATLTEVGTATGNSLPWGTSELVHYVFPGIKKSDRGRVNLPPFAESFVAAHVITSGAITSLKLVFDVFYPAIHSGGMQSFVYNRLPDKDGTPAFTKQFPSQYRLSNKPSTQKRRVRKVIPTYTLGGSF